LPRRGVGAACCVPARAWTRQTSTQSRAVTRGDGTTNQRRTATVWQRLSCLADYRTITLLYSVQADDIEHNIRRHTCAPAASQRRACRLRPAPPPHVTPLTMVPASSCLPRRHLPAIFHSWAPLSRLSAPASPNILFLPRTRLPRCGTWATSEHWRADSRDDAVMSPPDRGQHDGAVWVVPLSHLRHFTPFLPARKLLTTWHFGLLFTIGLLFHTLFMTNGVGGPYRQALPPPPVNAVGGWRIPSCAPHGLPHPATAMRAFYGLPERTSCAHLPAGPYPLFSCAFVPPRAAAPFCGFGDHL